MTDWACCMPQNTVLYILINFHTFISWSRPLQGMDPCVPPPPPHPLLCVAEATKCNSICSLSLLPSLLSVITSKELEMCFISLSHSSKSVFIRAVVWLYPFTVHICFCKHFFCFVFFNFFAYMCYRGDPLDLCLISSAGTRQCDSLGFITHENSGMSL